MVWLSRNKFILIIFVFLGGLGVRIYSLFFSCFYSPLKTLGVLGCEKISKEDLLKVTGLKKNINLLTLSLQDLEKKIKTLPWVRHVWIWRRLPSTLCIVIQEKKPWALWKKDNNNKSKQSPQLSPSFSWLLIDERGKVITQGLPEHYPHLMLIYGHQSPQEFSRLLRLLWCYGRFLSIQKAHYHPSGRWDLVLNLHQSSHNRLLLGLDSPYGQQQLLKKSISYVLLKMPWTKEFLFLHYLEKNWFSLIVYKVLDGRFPDGLIIEKNTHPSSSLNLPQQIPLSSSQKKSSTKKITKP